MEAVSPLRFRSGPRTLILTHLRKEEEVNRQRCERFWVQTRDLFAERVYLQENNSSFLSVEALRAVRGKVVYSRTGAVDDYTPPAGRPSPSFLPASELGIAGRGHEVFVLGGGLLENCLFNTFDSLIRMKIDQGQPLQAIIPLPLIYHQGEKDENKRYLDLLRESASKKKIGDYQITLNGTVTESRSGLPGPTIELHWFTTLRNMFYSALFPDRDKIELEKAIL